MDLLWTRWHALSRIECSGSVHRREMLFEEGRLQEDMVDRIFFCGLC